MTLSLPVIEASGVSGHGGCYPMKIIKAQIISTEETIFFKVMKLIKCERVGRLSFNLTVICRDYTEEGEVESR